MCFQWLSRRLNTEQECMGDGVFYIYLLCPRKQREARMSVRRQRKVRRTVEQAGQRSKIKKKTAFNVHAILPDI